MTCPWTRSQKMLALLGLILLAGMFGQLMLRWNDLPNRVPTHFNAQGEIDHWGPKATLFTLPIIGATIWLTVGLVLCSPPEKWNMPCRIREERKPAVYRFTRTMLLIINTELLAFFAVMQTFILGASPFPAGAFWPLMALCFATAAALLIGIFRLNRPGV